VVVATESFQVVIWFVGLGGLLASAIAFAGAGEALGQLGKGDFAINEDLGSPRRGPAPPTPDWIRDEEIRQMLQAKSDFRVARGEAPLDIELEFAKLAETDPARAPAQVQFDSALREEVRQLVVARNERRMRRGEAPLEVEAEVDRQLRDLSS
jgi:hypothetical protein